MQTKHSAVIYKRLKTLFLSPWINAMLNETIPWVCFSGLIWCSKWCLSSMDDAPFSPFESSILIYVWSEYLNWSELYWHSSQCLGRWI